MHNSGSGLSAWLASRRGIILLNFTLLVFAYCYFQGWLSGVVHWFNQSALVESNSMYLTQLETQLLADYASIMLLSAVVDVAASSQFGLSFIFDMNVQVGELLDNLAQILDRGEGYLLIAIAAVAALEIVALLSDFLAPKLFELLLVVGFIWSAIAVFYRQVIHSTLATQLFKLLAMLFLVTHIAIPYTIHLSSGATTVIDQLLGTKQDHHYFSLLSDELNAQQSVSQKSDLKDKGKSGVHFLHKAASVKLHHKVQRSSHVVMRSAARLLLTLVVIPGLLLCFHILLLRYLLSSVGRKAMLVKAMLHRE